MSFVVVEPVEVVISGAFFRNGTECEGYNNGGILYSSGLRGYSSADSFFHVNGLTIARSPTALDVYLGRSSFGLNTFSGVSQIAIIVGSCFAGVALIAVIVVLIVIIRKRKKRAQYSAM